MSNKQHDQIYGFKAHTSWYVQEREEVKGRRMEDEKLTGERRSEGKAPMEGGGELNEGSQGMNECEGSSKTTMMLHLERERNEKR